MKRTYSETKQKRQEYLGEILNKYTHEEPILSDRDIAQVIVWWCGDLTQLLKAISQEVKKDN